jgi:HAD superfamily hydrolase (TIGR01549 family)
MWYGARINTPLLAGGAWGRRRVIRCVIYDIGGTLLYPAPPVAELAAFAEQAGGFRLDHGRLAAALPNICHFFAEHDRPLASLWASDHKLDAAWRAYYTAALRDAGVDAPAAQLQAVAGQISAWYAHPDRWGVYGDVPATLAEARRRGHTQGVISDWESTLPVLLHGLGLEFHFDFIVASAAVGYAKPSPEIFAAAVARAGVAAHQCLYVGDSYLHDILGARTAGLHTVLVDRDGAAPPLDCPVVRTLDGIFTLIDALDRAPPP